MIVRLFDIRNATVCHECDPNIPVVARRAADLFGHEWIRLQGSQLKVALVNPKHKELYNDKAWYYLYNRPETGRKEWEEVKHEHLSFNSAAKDYIPDVDTTYVFRVQGYDELGYPKVLVTDAVKARLFSRKHSKNFMEPTVVLKPTCVRFHKPISKRRA